MSSFCLAFLNYDIQSVPRSTLHPRLKTERTADAGFEAQGQCREAQNRGRRCSKARIGNGTAWLAIAQRITAYCPITMRWLCVGWRITIARTTIEAYSASVLKNTHALIEEPFGPDIIFPEVLEVGAGTLAHLPFVRHRFDRYIASDLDQAVLDAVKDQPLPSRVELLKLDGSSLPFDDDSFDRLDRDTCPGACAVSASRNSGMGAGPQAKRCAVADPALRSGLGLALRVGISGAHENRLRRRDCPMITTWLANISTASSTCIRS